MIETILVQKKTEMGEKTIHRPRPRAGKQQHSLSLDDKEPNGVCDNASAEESE